LFALLFALSEVVELVEGLGDTTQIFVIPVAIAAIVAAGIGDMTLAVVCVVGLIAPVVDGGNEDGLGMVTGAVPPLTVLVETTVLDGIEGTGMVVTFEPCPVEGAGVVVVVPEDNVTVVREGGVFSLLSVDATPPIQPTGVVVVVVVVSVSGTAVVTTAEEACWSGEVPIVETAVP